MNPFAKFISYVLGRSPDEFGLVTDDMGYIAIKELLKALHEEDGWRHIRLAHLNEVALTAHPCPIEIKDDRIRACQRDGLPQIMAAEQMPKPLYIAVRRRAYPVILEKGLQSGRHSRLVLASDIEMAQRIGKRRDQQPLMLIVQVSQAKEKGTRFQKYGEQLYLADAIFPATFSGPPVPKDNSASAKSNPLPEPTTTKTPGSYFPELSPPYVPQRARRKEIEWKKDRRRARRHKSRQQE